ncbi:unnamed protein product [Rhodiola kirilowii]
MLPDATLGHASPSHHTSTYRSFFRSVSRIYYKLSSRSSKNKDTYLLLPAQAFPIRPQVSVSSCFRAFL